ncbi:U3 small nucleolar RNA-associated protein 6-domain-containing protein [Xylariaceae sp. FL0016]|nr:U3 small nucleolar RNA-associated protein 6-domain-containing protein [Xylariaceae sp. FL0016]
MAGVPEKARFYLERAVPQLREFESKAIFSPDEIRSLVRKRTDYEHLVLSPGNKPTDWINYVAWEKSLEALRAKRCRRLEVRTSSKHTGQGRIFSILERAVSRHPASVDLWKEYLAYARDVKATKRYRKVMTRALRMHPARPDLWILAGKRSAANGDMQAARGFFMRGTRFCTRDATIWTEYASSEMEWLARMDARKAKKGGTERALAEQAEKDDDEIRFDEEDSDEETGEDGQLVLPDSDKTTANLAFDDDAAKKLINNPALDGAIPLAIFDVSTKQPFFNATVAGQFFELFASFENVLTQAKILQHVLDNMSERYPGDATTCYCYIRQPLIAIDINAPSYPKAIKESLTRLKSTLPTTSNPNLLVEKISSWMNSILAMDNLDPGIRMVLDHTLRTLPKP